MSDLQAIADRVEIEALRGELTDVAMMRDFDRGASLFTPDAVVRMPHLNVELVGREEIRAWGGRARGLWDYFVQTTHPGSIQLDGDTASGRAGAGEAPVSLFPRPYHSLPWRRLPASVEVPFYP